MLQAYVQRLKNLLDVKILLPVCISVLFGMGLTYYFIGERMAGRIGNDAGTSSAKPAAEDTSGGDRSDAQIVVDISGAVVSPGPYKLDRDSRVGDLLVLASGMSPDASVQYISRKLNLAQKLEDSQKIYIPFEWDTYEDGEFTLQPISVVVSATVSTGSQPKSSGNSNSGSSSGSGSGSGGESISQKTNVNSASAENLDKLPGIGPAYAQRMIDNRQYKDYEELVSKSGIPKSTLEDIKDLLAY
jgi:competence protein ComEA